MMNYYNEFSDIFESAEHRAGHCLDFEAVHFLRSQSRLNLFQPFIILLSKAECESGVTQRAKCRLTSNTNWETAALLSGQRKTDSIAQDTPQNSLRQRVFRERWAG